MYRRGLRRESGGPLGGIGLSNSAIHYRLNKLRDEGVISGVTADMNPVSLELSMVAITEISVVHELGYSEHIDTELVSIDGIEQLWHTTGDVDFVAIARVQDRSHMTLPIEEMVAIDGFNETSSRFVMEKIKTTPRRMTNLSEEMRKNLVDDA